MDPKSLRNLVPGAILVVHFLGIFRNTQSINTASIVAVGKVK